MIAARQRWSAVLALASLNELEVAWAALAHRPQYHLLRPTETGLALVRGRIGGTGQPFNLGERTMTRAAVQLRPSEGGTVTRLGHVPGRQAPRAALARVFHALLQLPQRPHAMSRQIC